MKRPLFRSLCTGILTALCAGSLVCAQQVSAIPRTERELSLIMEHLVKTSVKYGQIPAITRARYLSVTDSNMSLEGRDPVFVVFFPTGPRIYPQKILVWHEIVNEVVDGNGYAITYSPISGGLAAYDTKLDGVNLILDNEGRLYDNNSVLVDRNTGSLWLQLLGMAFDGPLKGRGLKQIPVWWTTWRYACKAYPKARVLGAPLGGERKAYGRDPYGSYFMPNTYYSDERILYPLLTPQDRRLPPKNRILGFEYDKLLLAVDESYVKQKKVVNFFVGPTPLVAVHDPRLDVVRVFDRTVWNKALLFKYENGAMWDVDTQSQWSFDGKGLTGNLKDADMDEYTGIYAFWFVWSAFHPETLLVPGPTVVPDSALTKGQK